MTTTDERDPRIDKLPKWAQMRLEKLERDVAHYQAKLTVGPDDSDTFLDPYSDTPRPLGRGARVEFRTGGENDAVFHVYLDERGELLVHNAGHEALATIPQSTNMIKVRAVNWTLPKRES